MVQFFVTHRCVSSFSVRPNKLFLYYNSVALFWGYIDDAIHDLIGISNVITANYQQLNQNPQIEEQLTYLLAVFFNKTRVF